ncbi:50S ribosome-binding GTPase [Patescibacteria group bacterium]|nr:50S ribosome-binding GTPase [Patescibacteria group bacterium]
MLQDKVKIRIESGKGGEGSVAMYANRCSGGDGGKGGDVYLKGSMHTYDLSRFDPEKIYKAPNGLPGQQKERKGDKVEDLTLILPLTTEVYLENNLIGKIENDGQVLKILEGGVGGYGNATLIRNREWRSNDKERANQMGVYTLVLKLKSDVIFIGYPNAGKSSLLNELTNAHVKTAAYQFTTLEPQLGIMDGLVLMDLPGLIEGTYDGKGLGTSFVKHTENCKLVAHFVSLEDEDPYQSYTSMREEIRKISKDMYEKPEIVVLTKTDMVDEKVLAEVTKTFKDKGIKVLSTCIIDEQSIDQLKETFKSALK